MKYQVIEAFKGKTSSGEIELQPGQIVTLPQDKAINLLNEGKITPIEKAAYKVYSEVLQAYLWIIDTDQDMHVLRERGITEAVYTADEIRKLKGIDREGLKAVPRVKEVFPESKIEEINRNADNQR